MTGLAALAPFLEIAEGALYAMAGVFARVGAAVALLPGFGETALPARVKLAAALVFAMVVWPAVAPGLGPPPASAAAFGLALAAEAVAGLLIGLSARLMIMALQTAGTVAAQATSVAQMFGEGLTADPQPAFANLLAVAGVALAFALGLPAYAAAAMIGSYEVIPFATFPADADLAQWGVARVAGAFAVALGLAAPFLVAAFAYNLALGAINKAMPQLMVAFVGAPAITAGALVLMALTAPVALAVWSRGLERALLDPFGPSP
jgi:flagellar biosynthetic protein FliR